MAVVTEYTVRELIANETRKEVMGTGAPVTQCAVMELTIDAME